MSGWAEWSTPVILVIKSAWVQSKQISVCMFKYGNKPTTPLHAPYKEFLHWIFKNSPTEKWTKDMKEAPIASKYKKFNSISSQT